MTSFLRLHLLSSLALLLVLPTSSTLYLHGVEFAVTHVPNTVGGRLFLLHVTVEYAETLMAANTYGIWTSIYGRRDVDLRRKLHSSSLSIRKLEEEEVALSQRRTTFDYDIFLNKKYIAEHPASVEREVHKLIAYEIAFLLLPRAFTPMAKALKDGIATYVVIVYSYQPTDWAERGEGERWDESSDVTAQFLRYCEHTYADFIQNWVTLLEAPYDDIQDCFPQIARGKTVEEVWQEYKGKYGRRTG